MSTGDAAAFVTVNALQVRATHDFMTEDPFVWAAVQKINEATFMGGLDITTTRFDKAFEASETHKRVISTDWVASGKAVNAHFYYYGYACCVPVPHPDIPGEKVLNVVSPLDYELSVLFFSQLGMQFFVRFKDIDAYESISLGKLLRTPIVPVTPGAGGKRKRGVDSFQQLECIQVQANANNLGYPLMGGGTSHLLFVHHIPTRDGFLQSPVAMMRFDRQNMRYMMSDQVYASYWGSHPSHVCTITKDSARGRGGTTGREATYGMGQYANKDIHDDGKTYVFELTEQNQAQLQIAGAFAKKNREFNDHIAGRMMRNMLGSTRASTKSDGLNPHSMLSPFDANKILPPVDQTVTAGPVSAAYGNIDKFHQIVYEISCFLMGLPPQSMSPEGQKFAADDQGVLRSWDELIQSRHRVLSSPLEYGFRAAYYELSKRYVNDVYAVRKQQPAQTEDEVYREEYETALKNTGQEEEASLLEKERHKTFKQSLQSNIKVSINYNYVPKNTLEMLQAAMTLNMIKEDVFVRMAGALLGIAPGDLLLTQKERDAEAKRKTQIQQKDMEGQLKLQQQYAPAKPGKDGASSKPSGFGGAKK
jgi:hypothetical protein